MTNSPTRRFPLQDCTAITFGTGICLFRVLVVDRKTVYAHTFGHTKGALMMFGQGSYPQSMYQLRLYLLWPSGRAEIATRAAPLPSSYGSGTCGQVAV